MVKSKSQFEVGGGGVESEQMNKKFDEHEQSLPVQMTLFFLEENSSYSHSIELYDALPKFVVGQVERVAGVYLPMVEREFEFRGRRLKILLSPAGIKNKKGIEKYYYLGLREEVVQDALRKLMVEGRGAFLDHEASVIFTIYQLQQELKNHGHSYSKIQIKDALKVLFKTSIEILDETGKKEVMFHPIELLGINGEEDETQTFAKFSSLVTKSIWENSFRLFNYKTVMSYKSVFARRLHKRMAHFYLQASISNHWHIKLTTLIRDFGFSDKNYNSTIKNLESALDEMYKKGVIQAFKIEKEYSKEGKRKILDALIKIYPSINFVNEVKHANAEVKNREKMLEQSKLPKLG